MTPQTPPAAPTGVDAAGLPAMPGAARAAAESRAARPPELSPIPAPEQASKRTLRCPYPDCNRRFTRLIRYELHWRVKHEAGE